MGRLVNALTKFFEHLDDLAELIGKFGILSGFLLVFLESIIPILPLSLFVVVNINTYGNILGYLVSYAGTVVGCICAYLLCRKFNEFIEKRYKGNKKVREIKKKIGKIRFPILVVILSVPFTPAFAINIAAGLTNYDFKKYVVALLIGKLPMIYFWAFIGASLKESIADPIILVKILVMLIIAYIISKIVSKFLTD